MVNDTKRAVVIHQPGGTEQLRIEAVPRGLVGPGDARVAIEAISVNFRDVQQRRGLAPGQRFPCVPGSDFAGTVMEIGSNVETLAPGDPVFGLVLDGAYAEEIVVPAAMLLPLPDGLDAQTACILPVAGLSASFLLSVAGLEPGATAVTFAPAGGLGCFLGGLLNTVGVRSIGLTSSADKVRAATAAGHLVAVNYRDVDSVTAVLEATEGRGADVVFNSVGGPDFARSFDMCRNEGTVILCGRAAGPPDLVDLGEHLIDVRRNLALREFYLATHVFDHLDEIPRRFQSLAEAARDGQVRVPITTYDFDDVGAAHELLESAASIGKIVLTVRRNH
jgi:NADPH2:quinone reductase